MILDEAAMVLVEVLIQRAGDTDREFRILHLTNRKHDPWCLVLVPQTHEGKRSTGTGVSLEAAALRLLEMDGRT